MTLTKYPVKYAGHLLFPHVIQKEVEAREIRKHVSSRVRLKLSPNWVK